MQRLFSTFANGWPGKGLLLQRVLTAAALLYCGIASLRESLHSTLTVPEVVGTGAGILLLLGLWTPLAGMLAAAAELWIAFSHADNPWIPIILATLASTLAMIGPGAWSFDARLFGRKRIRVPKR